MVFCCILIFHVLICSFSIGCLDILMTCLFLSNSDYSIMLTAIPQFLSCNPLLFFVLLTNLCHITVIQMIGFPGYQFRFNSSFSTKGNVCNKSGRCHLFFIRFICLSFCFCYFIRDLLLWINLELSHILWGLTWAISSWLSVMEYPSGSMRPPQGFDDVLWCSVFRFLWCLAWTYLSLPTFGYSISNYAVKIILYWQVTDRLSLHKITCHLLISRCQK